jgi:hypothetical protein
MNEGDDLFERVVELCGFSAYVGPGAVRRSLAEAGCENEVASPDDYRRALPALQRRLQVYVSEEDATARVQQIQRMLEAAEREPRKPRPRAEPVPDDETKWGKRRFGNTVAILQQARDGIRPEDDE